MKTILFSLFMALMTLGAFAQNKQDKTPKTPEEYAKVRSEKLTKELGLNADQKAKVYDLLLNKRKKIQEIRAKYPNDKKAAHAEAKPVKEQFKADMKAVLTPEQYAKWEEMQKQKEAERKAKKAKPSQDFPDDADDLDID
jgi:Spy/CpxP family protein refolding chaperone